jgi:hypothetical protein
MASDRKQFERAYSRWQDLVDRRRFSVPPDKGATAILSSHAMVDSGLDKNEVDVFDNEASQIAKNLEAEGYESRVFLDATIDDVKTVLTDRTVSDVIVIGHGALPYVYMLNGIRRQETVGYQTEYNNRVDWRDVSAAADHLKTGVFTQRFCGNYVRKLSVPLGMFAVSNFSRVVAVAGLNFSPANLEDPQNQKLYPVLSNEFPFSYGLLKRVFDNDDYVRSQMVE